ncbi:MAG: hypothetical protein QM722_01595 [Piscinibacter sp.]
MFGILVEATRARAVHAVIGFGINHHPASPYRTACARARSPGRAVPALAAPSLSASHLGRGKVLPRSAPTGWRAPPAGRADRVAGARRRHF